MNKILLTSLMAGLTCPLWMNAQIVSNGTGGGAWSDGTTWQGGTPPTNANFTILSTDTVTATGVSLSSTSRPTIDGTFNVNNGTVMTVGRLLGSTPGGTININDGAVFTAERYTATHTVNINSGGYFHLTSLGTNTTATNVFSGGVWETDSSAALNSVVTLDGGTIIQNDTTKRGIGTWNSGTVIANGGEFTSNTEAANVFNKMTSQAHILQISDQTTAQTLALNNSFSESFANGVLRFQVYSGAANDSDQMTSTLVNLAATSDVSVEFEDLVALPGVTTDYIGTTYQLFNDGAGSYGDITPTLITPTWTIGGESYFVTFTNNLSVDGTLTVNGFTAIPEPRAYALIGGLLALGFCLRRRMR